MAVEEKSIIDYNSGNPDGELAPGETPRPPKVPLVAVYPKEGTLYSDNPFMVLGAEWVTEEQKQAAALFEDYVQQPENQARVLERLPARQHVDRGRRADRAGQRRRPSRSRRTCDVPEPEVLVRVLGVEQQRKSAQVLLVMDVSGSMGDPAGEITDATKLELARDAAVAALDQFKDSDQVGLRIFTTDIGDVFGETYLDLVPIGAMDEASGPSCASRSRPLPANGNCSIRPRRTRWG